MPSQGGIPELTDSVTASIKAVSGATMHFVPER